jgi:hypothetical protein
MSGNSLQVRIEPAQESKFNGSAATCYEYGDVAGVVVWLSSAPELVARFVGIAGGALNGSVVNILSLTAS